MTRRRVRQLSFTTGIQQQLLPFGDRIGLLNTPHPPAPPAASPARRERRSAALGLEGAT